MNPWIYSGYNSGYPYNTSYNQQLYAYQQGMMGSAMLGIGKKTHKAKVVEQDAPVYGWRNYNLNHDGTLQGARQEWPEREMQAECMHAEGASTYDISTVLHVLGGDKEAFDVWKRNLANQPNGKRMTCLEHLEKGNCPDEFGCGIWARASAEPGLIMAHCLAYGTVVTDDDGNWRASDVRIEALYINKQMWQQWIGQTVGRMLHSYIDFDRMAADLYSKYVVPVKVIEDLDELNAD